MNIKYIVLDFGKVIAGPTTGNWFITPKFKELVNMNLINLEELNKAFIKYKDIKNGKIMTLEEEYNMFYNFYDSILKEINYPYYSKKIIEDIAYNFTYQNDKYTFYKNVKKEIEELSKKYTLILLSDNWPCVIRIMKENKIYNYFDRIYVSSFYGKLKEDRILFDYLINDYKLKENEAIFIDDNELLLDIAKEKGFIVKLMDRYNEVISSKYEIINNLKV